MANPASPEKSLIVQDEDDLFYFESDHLALKGNKDYSDMLKTIFILEAQQNRAVKDYDKVIELQKQANDDPQLFIDKLKNGESIGVPSLQIIAEIPAIDWTKYKVKIPDEGLKFLNENSDKNFLNREQIDKNEKVKTCSLDTHNKSWSTEEQKRLEELLVLYPPEAVEFRRFKKIAAALGNRTVQQVSSRVQKYFLKLYKAGLPIPGRIPKYAERCKKSKLHIHQKNNHYLFKPSTFFPQFDLPVVMNEAEEIPGPSGSADGVIPSTVATGNYLISSTPQEELEAVEENLTEEPKDEINLQIELLRKIKEEKRTANDFQLSFQHYSYRCDYCDEEPIVGTRWHCVTCTEDSIDFCSDCVISQLYSGNAHPPTHKLLPVRYEDGSVYNDSSSESLSGSTYNGSNKRLRSSDGESENNSDSEFTEQNDEQNTENYDFSNVIIKFEQGNENNELVQQHSKIGIKKESSTNIYEGSRLDTLDEDINMDDSDSMNENISNIHKMDFSMFSGDSVKSDENVELDESSIEMFTETQNVAYSYLHARLLDDNV